MKTHILPAIKLTLICFVLVVIVYTGIVWGFGQLVGPNHAKGDFENIGQAFKQDKYFNSRPSAIDYNAAGSAGSNKGPSNPDYLALVQTRIDTYMVHNPEVKKEEIPAELVLASGSGLDPNISPKGALVQVKRIAKVRNLSEQKITTLVNEYTEMPFLGLFGTSKVNVLKLNTALDKIN
jgi:K+-transporting ATPase ATPase C chain